VIVGACALVLGVATAGLFAFLKQSEDSAQAAEKQPVSGEEVRKDDKPREEVVHRALKPKPQEPAKPRLAVRPKDTQPRPIWEGHKATVWAVAFSEDGRLALSGSGSIRADAGSKPDNSIRLWDAFTGKEVRCLNKFPDSIKSVAFSPNGRFAIFSTAGKWVNNVYIPTKDHSVHLWDLETDRELKLVIDNPGDVAAAKESVPRFRGHTDEVWTVAFSPDGRKAAAGSRNSIVIVWDVNSGKQLCVCKADRTGQAGHKDAIYRIVFSPDSQRIASGSYDFSVRLWSAATGQQLRCFKGHTDITWSVAFSPDGKYVLSGSGGHLSSLGAILPGTKDYTIRLWNAETGEEIRQFRGHTHAVRQAVFSPDGKYIVSGGLDRTVRFWEVATGNELRCFTGHKNWIRSVAISPDGLYALSGGEDMSLRLWELPVKPGK
jgi:WD40 repeat protein